MARTQTSRLTTVPAKKLSPVRVIDTSKGAIVVRGEGAWKGHTGGGGGSTTVTAVGGESQANAQAIVEASNRANQQAQQQAQLQTQQRQATVLRQQRQATVLRQQEQQRQMKYTLTTQPAQIDRTWTTDEVERDFIPPKEGSYGLGGKYVYRSKETGEIIGEETKVLQASTKSKPIFTKQRESLAGTYNIINSELREGITEPVFQTTERIGLDLTSSKLQETFAPPLFGVGLFGYKPKVVKEFYGGFQSGIMRDIREQPLKQIVLYGVSAGVGAGISSISSGLFAIPKVGTALGTIFKAGTVGGGLYLGGKYITKTTAIIISTPNYTEKGSIFGVSLKDIGLGSLGYQRGVKGYQQIQGIFTTGGRTEITIPQGEYPQAPTSKQLYLFRKNVYSSLSPKPGAFHTTGQKFWGTKINPSAGASELPGLYGSTKLSTPFTRIQGSGVINKLTPALKDLFGKPNKPAVAYLVPKGFRDSSVGFSNRPTFINQVPIKGRGYAYFKSSAIKGIGDVPGIKSEIETIFRPESGEYTFSSGKYYTLVKDVRVPIDVFNYGGTKVGTVAGARGGVKLYGGKGSYSIVTSSSFLNPNIALITSTSSYSKSSPSITSFSYTSYPSQTKSYISSKSSSKVSSSSLSKSSSNISSSISSSIISSVVSSRVSNKSFGYSYVPSRSYIKPTIVTTPPRQYYQPKTMKSSRRYTVEVRRFGKFRPIGTFGSLGKAFEVGRGRVTRTLGVTFKIRGLTQPGTPKGFYSKTTREGRLFIQQPKYRLSSLGEKGEIQMYSNIKRKRRKR